MLNSDRSASDVIEVQSDAHSYRQSMEESDDTSTYQSSSIGHALNIVKLGDEKQNQCKYGQQPDTDGRRSSMNYLIKCSRLLDVESDQHIMAAKKPRKKVQQ